MGYRSQVAIGMTASLYKKNKKLIDSLMQYHDEKVDNIEKVYFLYDSVKWYEGYPEIDAIEKFIRDHIEESCLVRIGEEYEDIEMIGDNWSFDLHIKREIEVPEPKFDTKAKKVLFKK